jgi:RNA polymerase sigma factor (sigma-70 family)
VLERALRYRKSYDRSKGEPAAWLLGIARRCVNAALAARAADQRAPELVEAADGRSVEEDSVRRLTLAAAMVKLSDKDQELLALRFGADLTAAQIAGIMDAKTNAVEVALHRALDRLRSILESQGVEAVVAPRVARSGAR